MMLGPTFAIRFPCVARAVPVWHQTSCNQSPQSPPCLVGCLCAAPLPTPPHRSAVAAMTAAVTVVAATKAAVTLVAVVAASTCCPLLGGAMWPVRLRLRGLLPSSRCSCRHCGVTQAHGLLPASARGPAVRLEAETNPKCLSVFLCGRVPLRLSLSTSVSLSLCLVVSVCLYGSLCVSLSLCWHVPVRFCLSVSLFVSLCLCRSRRRARRGRGGNGAGLSTRRRFPGQARNCCAASCNSLSFNSCSLKCGLQ